MKAGEAFELVAGEVKDKRGGKRVGAGRPRGSTMKARLECLGAKISRKKMTPIDTMLLARDRFHAEALRQEVRIKELEKQLRRDALLKGADAVLLSELKRARELSLSCYAQAAEMAKMAAPYLAARLASVEVTPAIDANAKPAHGVLLVPSSDKAWEGGHD